MRTIVLALALTTLVACSKDDGEAGDAGSGESNEVTTEADTTSTGNNNTASNIQDACCGCANGIQGSCEPWDDGDECEGVVVRDCELVGNQLICADEC